MNDDAWTREERLAWLGLAAFAGGVVDMYALRTLAANIAHGAALCLADKIGRNPLQYVGADVGVRRSVWKPGCQRPAPGWPGEGRG